MAHCFLAALLAVVCAALRADAGFAPLPPHKPPHPPHPFNPPIAFATAISGEGGPPIRDTPVGTPGTTTFEINWLTDVDPLAQCNDGSSAAYYYAPGSGSSANLWLVYLEGSMFCWGAASCQDRFATHDYWMSSSAKPWTADFAQGGIFATDGSSAWGNANRIYVKYCSSDIWSGDAAASNATYGYTFRGSRIVAAVMNGLMTKQGLGSTPGARLLFGGCSAGAIGAMNNIEAVHAMMPPTVQTWAFLDGAGLLDIQPRGWNWRPDLETLQSLMTSMLSFTNPQFPAYCAQLFPGELYKCLIGQHRMPLITSVPMFVNVPQFDMFNLMYSTDNYKPVSPSQFSFVSEFQAGILQLILSLPPGTGVFAPTCLVHCLSGQSSYHTLWAANTTLGAALSTWYYNGQGVNAVSDCVGWSCIDACGVDLQNSLPCNIGAAQCSALTLASEPGATTSTDTSGEAEAGEVPELMAQVMALRPLAAGGVALPLAPAVRAPAAALLFRAGGAPPSMPMAMAVTGVHSTAPSLGEKHSDLKFLIAALLVAAALAGWLVLRSRRNAARTVHRYHPIGDPDGLPMRRVQVR